jgi:hypothetical protein
MRYRYIPINTVIVYIFLSLNSTWKTLFFNLTIWFGLFSTTLSQLPFFKHMVHSLTIQIPGPLNKCLKRKIKTQATCILFHVSRNLSRYKYMQHKQYCHSMWTNESGAVFLLVNVVKFNTIKA